MKKIILLLLIVSTNAMAFKLEISNIEITPGFDVRYKLTEKASLHYGILDCQSFLKKMDFYNTTNTVISDNTISNGECQFMHQNIKECLNLNKMKCIDSSDIFNTSCNCQ